jgi:RNA polymerase sigma factor (sigma-70 family)
MDGKLTNATLTKERPASDNAANGRILLYEKCPCRAIIGVLSAREGASCAKDVLPMRKKEITPNKGSPRIADRSEDKSCGRPPENRPGKEPQGASESEDRSRTGDTGDSEAILVRAAMKGDINAFEELIVRHRGAVVAQSYAVVGDYHVAEDLAQEAFVKAYESLADLKDPRKFAGWLSVIVRHTCVDWLRTRKGEVSLEAMKDEGFEIKEPVGGEASLSVEDAEEDRKVLAAMAELREDYREILVMKHMENMSYREIADRLNMTVSAVGEKLSRVRGILKSKLEKKRVPRPDKRP